jgi:hypothetical protein
MATLKPIKHRTLTDKAAYYQLSRLLARQVRIGEFHGRELYDAMQRPAVRLIAELAVKKYFNRGEDSMKVKKDMRLMYQALLVMAPILQRIPRSLHLDQHRGHVLTWLRVYAGGNARRRFVSVEEVKRIHKPAMLIKRLERLGIHDRTFCKVLAALYRAYYWRDTVAGSLARIIFDAVMIEVPRDRHVLRIGNCIYTLHKQGGSKTVNMNKVPFVIFDYAVRYDPAADKNKMTITLSPAAVASFKKKIRGVMARQADPKYKIEEIEEAIEKFSERSKWAKDTWDAIIELRDWLWKTMQPLATPQTDTKTPKVSQKHPREETAKGREKAHAAMKKELKAEAAALKVDISHVPNTIVNKWKQKRVKITGLIRARNNVLYDLDRSVDRKDFMNFLSPYREV